MQEKLQPELNEYLLGIRLDGVASVFREYQHEIEKEDKSIEEAALVFLPENWAPQDDTLRKERGDAEIMCFPCNQYLLLAWLFDPVLVKQCTKCLTFNLQNVYSEMFREENYFNQQG